jgi:hypothetical protein
MPDPTKLAPRMTAGQPLSDLRADFLATSTRSMPIAGMVFWAIVGMAALRLSPNALALLVLFGSGMVFPFGVLLDRLFYRRMKLANNGNPVVLLFLQCLALVVLLWPFVILAARAARSVDLIVLGGAILMGIIWIPFGWAAGDPVGMHHAIGRSVLCYLAYVFVPAPYTATAIGAAVILAYAYSMVRMRKPLPLADPG